MFGWESQEQLEQWFALQQQKEESEVSLSFGDDLFKSIRIEGNFTLTSGKKSNYFYDFERMSPNYMTFVSGLLHEKLVSKGCEFEFAIGPAYGGIIPAHTVADFAGKSFLSYFPKTNEFRGQIKNAAGRYVIVDDVISTYETVASTIKAVDDKFPGARCVGVACFVFRGQEIQSGFPFTYYLQKGEVEV